MTIQGWINTSTNLLISSGITTARLDCLVLLEDITGHDRSWLLAYPDTILQIEQLKKLNTKIEQRALNIPLAYIRGFAEFYGRTFTVNSHTLVPRPETETMIDLLKSVDLPDNPSILDVGTGTGCIAITTALEILGSRVTAIDIDPICLETAQNNASMLRANIVTMQSDLLANVTHPFDVVLANLPYVPVDYPINHAATHEPELALFSGTDGLDHYRQLFSQLKKADQPQFVLTESLPEQHEAMQELARHSGFKLRQTNDFIQVFCR